MDTNKDSTASEVPTFKVARVGNDRKRKGGGFSFLRSSAPRGAWSGATGGAGALSSSPGALNILGMTFSKAMVAIFMTATLGSAAVYLGARSASSVGASGDKKPAIFAQNKGDVALEGDTSNLPSTANTIPNSLGYLTGSRDGLTPEERAKKEAEAAAEAEAQRIADEEAAKKAEEEAAANKGPNPEDLLASAKADGKSEKDSGFAKKFGSLTSSFGGGSSLSGGAGLSGGVNRQFGSAGSIAKGASGQLTALKGQARPTYSKSARSAVGKSNVKGFARKQLANANALSRRGAEASKGETSAYDAASAFDNNQGAGNVISGPGIGQGKGSSNGTDTTPNVVDTGNNGGPTGTTTEDCASGTYMNADGGCSPIKKASSTSASKTVDMLAMIATGLLMTISVLAGIALMAEATVFGTALTGILANVIAVLGGIIALMGVAIIAMGDYFSGTVFTVVGGAIGLSAMGWIFPQLTVGVAMVGSMAGALLGQAAKMLDPKKGTNAPAAAQ